MADVSLALSRASLHEIVDHVVRKTPRRLCATLNWPLLIVLFLMCILSGMSCKGFLKLSVNSNVS